MCWYLSRCTSGSGQHMVIVLGLPGGCGKSMLVRAITNLMANPSICEYQEEHPGTLHFQHRLLNRGYPRLTLVRGSRLTLVTGNAGALGRCGNGAVVRVLRDEESQNRSTLHSHCILWVGNFRPLCIIDHRRGMCFYKDSHVS